MVALLFNKGKDEASSVNLKLPRKAWTALGKAGPQVVLPYYHFLASRPITWISLSSMSERV